MIKSILICTDGSRHGDVAVEYAIQLARRLKAQLAGLHVLDSRMLEGPLMADISGWIGAQPYGGQLQQFRDVLENKGEAVASALYDRCTQQGMDIESNMRMGHPSRVIIEAETDYDLVVLGQRGLHADLIGESMGSTVERVVRQSDKPCMVTPTEYKDLSKVLAAYDGSDHARHALQVAVDVANGLEVELIVLTVAEDDDVEESNRKSEEALQLVREAGGQAVPLVAESDNAPEAILQNAGEQGCDLIIMGAHGHSRIRELILGSATTYCISHSDIPVMLVR